MTGQIVLAVSVHAWKAWPLGVLAAVLVIASVTDVRNAKIPNSVTIPAIVIGLVGHSLVWWLCGRVTEWPMLTPLGALGGFAAGFLPMLAVYLAGGIGGGDVKLMGAIGALAGWRFVVAAMFYGFIIAAIMAVIVMLRRRIVRKTLARILQFVYLMFTPSKPADPADTDSAKIPLGLALCIGSAVVLIDFIIGGSVATRLWGI